LRECVAPGSEIQTASSSVFQAKYAVFTCAVASGDAVAMAQRLDASRSSCTSLVIRAAEIGRPRCSIGTPVPPRDRSFE
jgi:hypothetical protein